MNDGCSTLLQHLHISLIQLGHMDGDEATVEEAEPGDVLDRPKGMRATVASRRFRPYCQEC
jgi:hypothetical protein